MCVGKNTSQAASVEFVRHWRANYARSRLRSFYREKTKFFPDKLKQLPLGGCFLLTLYKYGRFYLARSAWMSFFRASTPRRTAELVSSVIF